MALRALWPCRLLVVKLCCQCCGAVFADDWDFLMAPVRTLETKHEHCNWKNPTELDQKASTSSEFEADIEVREDGCGNGVLLMGGYVQCHSADEHIYHEMMVHPAMVSFTSSNGRPPRTVFLGGSGDGAGPREVLRWKDVEKVTMVDIDYEVTRFTQEHIPSIPNGSLEDPRLNLITGDAVAYLREMPEGVTFDVLIMDFPDAFESPILAALYGEEFYRLCLSRMHPGSVLVTQSGPCSEVTRAGARAECDLLEILIVPNISAVFDHVQVMLHPMATWKPDKSAPSEWNTFTMARQRASAAKLQDAANAASRKSLELARGDGELRYYNSDIHHAAFSIPRPLSDRLVKAGMYSRRATTSEL
eukprot:TRINITY_DN106940_c0_g1_i1.p1 TRINITY_DN106940_c0_g1~~TRINITY_DN106940_c0_g1_i1.p1  ORF type:complete len:385 (+),score=67.82 TRINITY_DN106940_c0_g1_i1:74-1156(+)